MKKTYSVNKLIDKLAPSVRKAFLESFATIKNEAQLSVIIAHLRAGNVQLAVAAIHMGPEMFAPLDDAIRAAYLKGAADMYSSFPRVFDPGTGTSVVARFDSRNPRAEKWLADASSKRIVDIAEETRTAARSYLSSAMQTGISPREAALNLVGRVDRLTGKRVGGIIGLDPQKVQWRETAREILSGPVKGYSDFKRRAARPKQFDSIINEAIKSKQKLTKKQVNSIINHYESNLLRVRGNAIARTELLGSMHEAQNEGIQQLLDKGRVQSDQITSTWDAAEDMDTRPHHAFMDGQIRKQGERFVSGIGGHMLYPGDRSGDATAADIVQCRCRRVISIDFVAGLGRR